MLRREHASHIAIIGELAAQELLGGRKRVESRLSRTCRAPFRAVQAGDLVYFKQSGGGVIGQAHVASVRHWTDMKPVDVLHLAQRFNPQVRAPRSYWMARRRCRFATLIWLRGFRAQTAPFDLPRQYGNAWIVLARGAGPRP
jgi:hypothetical protein